TPIEHICSSSFIIRRLSEGVYSTYRNLDSIYHCLAEIEFLDVQHTLRISDRPDKHRCVSFALTGPEYYWDLYSTRRFHPDGTVSYFGGKPRKLVFSNKKTGVTCYAEKSYLYREDDQSGVAISKPLIVVCFRWHSATDHLPDESILSHSVAYANDITRLMSFVSRRDITWFTYWFEGKHSVLQYVRDLGVWAGADRNLDIYAQHSGPIEIRQVYPFLRKTRKTYQRIRENGYDLEQLIGLYLAGSTSRFVEEQFIALYRALEKFIAEYRRRQTEDGFISRERW